MSHLSTKDMKYMNYKKWNKRSSKYQKYENKDIDTDTDTFYMRKKWNTGNGIFKCNCCNTGFYIDGLFNLDDYNDTWVCSSYYNFRLNDNCPRYVLLENFVFNFNYKKVGRTLLVKLRLIKEF